MKDIKKLRADIKKMEALAGSEEKLKGVIHDELLEIAEKYGQPRRSEILNEAPDKDIQLDSAVQVEDYAVTLFITKDGYIKKVTPLSLRMSAGIEQKLKEGDEIKWEIETSNAREILLFTNKQNVYKAKVYDFADTKISVMGSYLPSELKFEQGEKLVFATCTKDYSGHMVFFYDNGNAVRIPKEQYATKLNRKKLIKCYSDKFKLLAIFDSWKEDDAYAIHVTNKKPIMIEGAKIVEKTTKSSVGARVALLKKRQKFIKVEKVVPVIIEQTSFEEGLEQTAISSEVLELKEGDGT